MRSKNFYLTTKRVYTLIQSGKSPSDICKQLKISKQKLTYYTRTLKNEGFIRKAGYKCWEILKDYSEEEIKKEVKKVFRIDNFKLIEIMKLPPNTIRSHFIQAKVILPDAIIKSNEWKRRIDFLLKENIEFKPIENFFGGGQSITFGKVEFILTNKSILISIDKSYFGSDVDEIKYEIAVDILKGIKKLERALRANFGEFGNYKFETTRQHHSLIKNCFAKVYLKSKKEYLRVSDKNGLWLLVDNSFDLGELECIHSVTALNDIQGVQNFFNSLKRTNFKVTPSFILQELNEIKNRIKELEEKIEREVLI